MGYYCGAFGCNSKSEDAKKIRLSFYKFPTDAALLKIWIDKIKRKNFVVTKNSRLCSLHFRKEDFLYSDAKRRMLRVSAIPSIFRWTVKKAFRKSPKKRELRADENEQARGLAKSAGVTVHGNNKGTQCSGEIACTHRESLERLLTFKGNLIQKYTGFVSKTLFFSFLEFLVPGMNRASINYWDPRTKPFVSGEQLFDSDEDITELEEETSTSSRDYVRFQAKLPLEDELLLTMMKLKLGLFNFDISTRFCISTTTTSRIFKTWVNLMYIRLGSLRIWPHRDIIISQMSKEFKTKFPNVMAIIDCTELKIQTPSSLTIQSKTYSNYKSCNTLKSLIAVDSRGSIMFVSQLFTGGISDKEICEKSGFYSLLEDLLHKGHLVQSDSVMADKGFEISGELAKLGLQLVIPDFLGKRDQLSPDEVQNTQDIAHHRIHVERAIGKVRNAFHLLDRKLPITTLDYATQLWSICCLLTNLTDSIVPVH